MKSGLDTAYRPGEGLGEFWGHLKKKFVSCPVSGPNCGQSGGRNFLLFLVFLGVFCKKIIENFESFSFAKFGNIKLRETSKFIGCSPHSQQPAAANL